MIVITTDAPLAEPRTTDPERSTVPRWGQPDFRGVWLTPARLVEMLDLLCALRREEGAEMRAELHREVLALIYDGEGAGR